MEIEIEPNEDGSPGNIADCYAENGMFLASIAWRPHEQGLLIC
jgi:hypothetical protein